MKKGQGSRNDIICVATSFALREHKYCRVPRLVPSYIQELQIPNRISMRLSESRGERDRGFVENCGPL
jgi:hypothetical protein